MFADENKLTQLHRIVMKEHIDILEFLTVEKYCDTMSQDI